MHGPRAPRGLIALRNDVVYLLDGKGSLVNVPTMAPLASRQGDGRSPRNN